MKHQIILLGKDITSVYHGIKEYGPDHIHLLYTTETREVAMPMLQMLPASVQHSMYLADPYNGESIMDLCRKVRGMYTGEFSYNLSEGTKIMAFAAWEVAKAYNDYAFYITQQGDFIGLDTFNKRPMMSTLNNDEIIRLNGNIITEYHDVKLLDKADVETAAAIKLFIEKHPQQHARIQKFFGIFCNRRMSDLPSSKLFSGELRFKQRNGALLITEKNEPLLSLPHSNACSLYFEGRWWETLVAEKVKEWSLRQVTHPEVWQSVIFQVDHTNSRTKNEVDVLLNNKQKLIFIECKSGVISQNNIYKIDAVRETYGGDISKAVLASYYPLEKSLQDKCRDLQISLFAPASVNERIWHLDELPEWLDKVIKDLLL